MITFILEENGEEQEEMILSERSSDIFSSQVIKKENKTKPYLDAFLGKVHRALACVSVMLLITLPKKTFGKQPIQLRIGGTTSLLSQNSLT